MEISRKDFIKGAGLASGLLLLRPPSLVSAKTSSESDVAMLVDVSKCVNCWWCYAACKNYNGLPETKKPDPEQPPELAPDIWTTLYTVKRDNKWVARKQACMHCTDAACVEVCPTGALSYNKLGFVEYDKQKCSGCGYCAEFCPFGVPQLESNKVTGAAVMDKCTFCIDRVTNGEQPACAEACPYGAIKFGKRSELLEEGKQRVAELNNKNSTKSSNISEQPNKDTKESVQSTNADSGARLYGANELGGLHVMYVLDAPPNYYGLPADPQFPVAATVRDIFKWIGIGAAAAVVAGFGLNYLIAREVKLASALPGKEQIMRAREKKAGRQE